MCVCLKAVIANLYKNDRLYSGEVSGDRYALVNIHDIQSRYMSIDGHEPHLEGSTNKITIVEREEGEEKEKTYDSIGPSGAFFCNEG